MDIQFTLPYADSYWVVPGKLLAGKYPGSSDGGLTRKNIQALLRTGINSFIDLTLPGDVPLPYSEVLEKEASDYGMVVSRLNFPVADFSTPTPDMMRTILDIIDHWLQLNRMVYVHCLAGIGRTGTVVGCYLVRHGFTGEAAVEHISYLRRDLPNWWHRSPEMDDQLEFILNWPLGS